MQNQIIMKFTISKRSGILLILLQLAFNIHAQTWTGTGGLIPDDGTPVMFPIDIDSLDPSTLDTLHGITTVGLNITHTYDSDLYVALVAPDGTFIVLTSSNGWDGDNYTDTHFTDTATTSITQGNPPFTGYFRPQELLGTLNNGRNGIGTWNLYILDTYPWADQGYLISLSITFGDNPTGPFVFNSSNLPIVIIDTYGQQIPDDPKILAGMKVIDNPPGQRNHINDTPVYDGYTGIEIRGSSSQMFPKKSYGLETWDAQGEELKVSLLGMPEETDWILNANYSDKTFCRNTLAYQLSWNMGHYATRYKHVEVVINDVYKGIYIFSEKIKRDANRVNIAKLKPDQNTGDPLTGGYIFKIDKPTGSGGGEGWESNFPSPANPDKYVFFQYEFPKAINITNQQKAYISDYVNTFETVLAGPDFDHPVTGYRQYIDEGSFLDYFIVNEISKNIDGYRLSTFLHKQRESLGGKIRIGPVWDYDIAWQNANYYNGEYYTGWSYQFPYPDDFWQVPFWWDRFLQDTTFANNLKCRWISLRDNILSDVWFDNYIDSVALVLNESQQRNFIVWPILGSYVWPNPWPFPQTYEEEITNLKNWIHNRLFWLDENLPGTCHSIGIAQLTEKTSFLTVNPNPAGYDLKVTYTPSGNKNVVLRMCDPSGHLLLIETLEANTFGKIEWHPDIKNLKQGVYFIIINEGPYSETIKFVKL